MPEITSLEARQILDSRGNPTVEVDATLSDGSCGRAAVPSGASTGKYESLELRDHRQGFYQGKSVEQAVANIEQCIFPFLRQIDPLAQTKIDHEMVARDGTANLSNFGANAVLAVSLAISKAAANSLKRPYYQYLHQLYQQIAQNFNPQFTPSTQPLQLPIPMFNVLNGGAHTDWQSTDVQEFMLIPMQPAPFTEHLRWCSEIYHCLEQVLDDAGYDTSLGDEGGYAPKVKSDTEAIDLILKAIQQAGYEAGKEIGIGIDAAASQFWQDNHYQLKIQHQSLSCDEMIVMWQKWVDQYPIVLLEDGLAEDDWSGWQKLNQQLGQRLPIVGDDLLVTNFDRIERAIREKACNSLLMKVNQIGTLSESMLSATVAKNAGWQVIVSHRSGETEDTSIADIAVAINANKIKAGAPAHSERTAKYNQLLRIEEELNEAK